MTLVQRSLRREEPIAARERCHARMLNDGARPRIDEYERARSRAGVAGLAQRDAIHAARTHRHADPPSPQRSDSTPRATAIAASMSMGVPLDSDACTPRGEGDTLPNAATLARPASG